MPSRSLGYCVNSALKEIGDPAITSFTSTNILQSILIEEVNECVEEIMTYGEFRWALKHSNFVTAADITTGQVAMTNGSSTVNSVDADDVSANNFGSVTTDMWIRRTQDSESYPIAKVVTSGSPDTLTLGVSAGAGSRNYVGTTTTGSGYRIFQDTYSLPILGTVTLVASSASGTYTTGETITGGTSSSTATIVLHDTGQSIVYLSGASAAFTVGETVTGGTSSVTSTVTSTNTTRVMDEIKHITYGQSATWAQGLSGQMGDNAINMVNMTRIMSESGGDLHRNTSGRPHLATIVSNAVNEDPRLLLWPFPTKAYLVDLWYKESFSDASVFSTDIFGGNAPGIAYQAVQARCKVRAAMFNEDRGRAQMWEQRYQSSIGHLMRRENREEIDAAFDLQTYRRDYGVTIPTRSGIYFDLKGAQR